jgi:hypothetical protein
VTLLLSLLFLLGGELFTVDASSETSYSVAIAREALKGYVDDIGLFERHMPGVVSVEPVGTDRYRYITEKELPLAGTMKTEFLIQKFVYGDTVTVYRSSELNALNYMYCRVRISPAGVSNTTIAIALRVRLSREDASEVHWMAPILGADFINDQMTKDLDNMLATFVERSNEELYLLLAPSSAASSEGRR